ncbi:MAG TPA: hypothetical protein VGK19_12670 [Capsulimonadaceae bacterium]|jgi:hypothetical protein
MTNTITTRFSPLLIDWCDGLVAHQLASPACAVGGLFCPACQIVHGRCGDAVYTLLAAFAATGREEYRESALALFDWSEEHATLPDGSWRNEVTGWPWRGITCFSLIALGEALRLHGDKLEPADAAKWRERLRRGADFLMEFMTRDTGNINYPLSTAASLASAWRVLGDQRYKERAHELANLAADYLTPEGFIWGEGDRGQNDWSGRRLRAIDLCYNAAETLPNLALYAHLTGDTEIATLVTRSFRTHLAFLLPDGGWDAGWSTRQCKWVYWGSRTSDGVASGLMLLAESAPEFADAAERNLSQLAACTHDGLLYGGPHAARHGLKPCIHHTIVSARGLASALHAAASVDGDPALVASQRQPDGARMWHDIATAQVAVGDWRSSVTAYDFPYLGTLQHHPSGGALTMLWHASTGPLAVASMNNYNPVEPVNMAAPRLDDDMLPLTPRVQVIWKGVKYSNIYNGNAALTHGADGSETTISATGILRDEHGEPCPEPATYTLTYRYSPSQFSMTALVTGEGCAELIFPVVSPASDTMTETENGTDIAKPGATVKIRGGANLPAPGPRIYNHVPGVEAIPFALPLVSGEAGTIKLEVQQED